eukprot:2663130-Amphidinium_carterae.1
MIAAAASATVVQGTSSQQSPTQQSPSKRRSVLSSSDAEARKAELHQWTRLAMLADASTQVHGFLKDVETTQAFGIVSDIFSMKSLGTLKKCMASLEAFGAWNNGLVFPIPEPTAYSYIKYLHSIDAPATRAQSFIEAVRFCHGAFGAHQDMTGSSSR